MAGAVAPSRNFLASRDALIASQHITIQELTEEIYKLRKGRSILSPASEQPPEPQSFRFLDLPAELRTCIYELCLVKGKVFLQPRPRYDYRYTDLTSTEPPEWSLLRVSHKVRTEAAKVLLSENLFVLSYDPSAVYEPGLFTRRGSHPKALHLGDLTRRHLCSVSVTLDLRSFNRDLLSLADDLRRAIRDDNVVLTAEERTMMTHSKCAVITSYWRLWCQSFPFVKFFQIDITNCYCVLGCHRLIERVAVAISCAYVQAVPEVLEILGTKSLQERARIVTYVYAVLQEKRHEGSNGVLRFKAFWKQPDPTYLSSAFLGLHRRDLDKDLKDKEIAISAIRSMSEYGDAVCRERNRRADGRWEEILKDLMQSAERLL